MKLITIDLDGTLLNNEGRVSPFTAEMITRVRNKGHKVVIATGRHSCTALPIVEELALTDAVVCFNGALVMNLENKQVEVAHSYVNNDVYHLTTLVKEWGYGYLTATQYRYHIEAQFGHLIKNYADNGVDVEEIRDIQDVENPIFKMSIVGTERELDLVEKYIQPAVSRLHVVRSGEEAIDVISPQASKGGALRWLANYYNVKREDTIAFGNYYNDISMLQYAGLGVAMQNAPEHIKKIADTVCYSNEEHGVARFLEEHILRKIAL